MRLTVAMIAVLALATVAGATEQVWFQATGLNSNSLVTTQGSAGHSTVLQANDPGINSSWTIDVWIGTTADFGGIIGYDIALTTPETDTTGSNPTWSTPTGWGTLVGSVGADGSLLRLSTLSGIPAAPLPAGSRLVASFTLTDVHGDVAEDDFIYGGTASFGWGFASSYDYPFVQYGGAAAIEGHEYLGYDNWATTPAITIHEIIPEPATLMLLGLGLVGLLRRR